MEAQVKQICNRYSKRFKTDFDDNLLKCFSALFEVLVSYHDNEQSLKSTEFLPTSLSSFRFSKSASLREFASQMTLDIQGSSSEEYLNMQSGCSMDTLSPNNRSTFSTRSLICIPDIEFEERDDKDTDERWSTPTIKFNDLPFEECHINPKDSTPMGSTRRNLSLGSNLHNISEELIEASINVNSTEVSARKPQFERNTIAFIDDLFKGVWERETVETDSALDLCQLPERQETLRNKYDRSKTIDMGHVEKERYMFEKNPRKSKRWIFGFGWMFKSKSANRAKLDSDNVTPTSILKDTVKIVFRLRRSLKKRKLEEDADILKEIAVKQTRLKLSLQSFGTPKFDLLSFQDHLGTYYSILLKYSRRHLSKNNRNLLTRLYAFYSRTYFLQTVTKLTKFHVETEKFCKNVASLL